MDVVGIRVLAKYSRRNIQVQFKHVPAHVGIFGNEKADRLAKSAVRRAFRYANLTPAQRQEIWINDEAENLVLGILAGL